MPRPIQIRPSYNHDAAWLLREVGAIDKDDRVSPDWKKKVRSTLQDAAVLLMKPDFLPGKSPEEITGSARKK